MEAPLPDNEVDRLAALHRLRVLDQGPSGHLDRLTRLAAKLFDVPMVTVSLVDSNRLWFASRQGLEMSEVPRCDAFCAHAILDYDMMIVPDTHADARCVDSPVVTEPPHIRFYVGAPLSLTTGEIIGTLCVMGREPRQVDENELAALRDIADAVEREFHVAELLLADPLTGLANRPAAEDAGRRILELARRRLEPISAIYLDLIGMRDINEERGHRGGDAHILRTAEVLRTTLRRSDVLARVGSDEFAAILPDVGADGLMIAADKIEAALADASALHPELPPLRVSLGVATIEPEETFAEFLSRAEQEAFVAKQDRSTIAGEVVGL